MDATLVDSPFYREPEEVDDAPSRNPLAPMSSQSRVIDIVSQEISRQIYVTYQAQYVTNAESLQIFSTSQLVDAGNGYTTTTTQLQALDRIYYENNWPFARSYLCRTVVKGVVDSNEYLENAQENRTLMRYQMFLNRADHPDVLQRLDFTYTGVGATSDLSVLLGTNRMLCHFGFDWLAICTRRIPNDEESTELKELDTGHGKNKWIVRRRLCTAAAIKLNSTSALSRSCPSGWESGNVLLHRRTLVLFNQLHSKGDGLDFKAWLSSPTLWTVSKLSNVTEDTQSTAIIFIYRLLNQIWGRVISEWKHIVDQCFEHIRTSEIKALDKGINVNGLEELAQKTWRDSLDWATLTQLLSAQKRTVSRAQEYLTRLAREVKVDSAVEDARLTQIVNDLSEVEKIISEDFPQREQRISDLVYNIIGVRNAQAAEEYNSQIGAVTWITFIFFPLIAVAGMFGMNVDVLADNPSIKWYFIIAIPITALVVIVAILIRGRIWIKKVILPGRRAKR